ncbi:hypothetical protein D3C81_1817180 [compost metagenome]
MRQRQTKVGHLRYVLLNNTQQVNAIALFTAPTEQLHTQTNPQNRLGTGFDQLNQFAFT